MLPSFETIYCYRCGRHHPREEMRQIETKTGKRWRCIKTILATKVPNEERDAYGKMMTALNKTENQARIRPKLHAEGLIGR